MRMNRLGRTIPLLSGRIAPNDGSGRATSGAQLAAAAVSKDPNPPSREQI